MMIDTIGMVMKHLKLEWKVMQGIPELAPEIKKIDSLQFFMHLAWAYINHVFINVLKLDPERF